MPLPSIDNLSIALQRDCRRAGQIAPVLCPDAVIDLAELFPNP